MRSTSSFERPLDAVIVIFCSFWVAVSFAETLTIPLASMSNVTSICGMPRGAGGSPVRWNRPSGRLSRAIGRSPCSTCTSTLVWLSAAVENVSLLRVGIVVFRGISVVITPPSVSMPRESGVTSSRSRSLTSPASTPAWIAAPTATTSSGLTPLCGSLPNNSFTMACTRGIRVDPPTSTTSSIFEGSTPASASACFVGPTVFCSKSSTSCSNLAWVRVFTRCLGPVWSAVMNGRLMSVSLTVESSILAFSAASLRRCSAIRSLPRSIPSSFLNSEMIHSMMRWSRLSPPRCVSPLVAFTSTTPSPTSRIEMSKVPPPKS